MRRAGVLNRVVRKANAGGFAPAVAVVNPPRKLNKRQKRQVKRLMNIRSELKFHGFQQNGITISTTPVSYDVTAIAQGDADTDRIGDRLMWASSCEARFQLYGPESGTGLVNDIYDTVRIIVFQFHPKATTGSSPAVADILLTGPTGAIDVNSHYNHDRRQDYKIVFDKTVVLMNNQNSTVGGAGFTTYQTSHVRMIKRRIRLNRIRKQCQFSGGSVDATNKFFMILLSDSSATPHPTINTNLRFYFRDS